MELPKIPPGDHAARRQAGVALKNLGDELTRKGGAENLARAVRACDEAIELLDGQPFSTDGSDRDELASAWMKRGIALLQTHTPESLQEAVRNFDKAIELRRKLPLAEDPAFHYGLAAGLINRGEALTRLGGEENADAAVSSHTEAIGLLKDLPMEDNALYLKRLSIAWLNRGIALEVKGSPEALAEAVASFQKVMELVDGPPHADDGEFVLIRAGARINYGNALLRSAPDSSAVKVCEAAGEALALLAGIESREPAAAEAGFKARHVLCQALIVLLMTNPPEAAGNADLIDKVTDTVEEGLLVARDWEKAGVIFFRMFATRLFHLGTLVYERHQPHFLAEFLLDHLDPERATCIVHVDKSWFAVAEESLARVRERLQASAFQFESLATDQGQKRLELLGELRDAEGRLQALRSAHSLSTVV